MIKIPLQFRLLLLVQLRKEHTVLFCYKGITLAPVRIGHVGSSVTPHNRYYVQIPVLFILYHTAAGVRDQLTYYC